MWTYNVVRELVQTTGRRALPEIVPQSDAEMEAIGRAGAVASGEDICVLKVHERIATDLPNSCYVVTRRDIRDTMMSFMRFMVVDFENGLHFVRSAIESENHLATFPPTRSIIIDYTDIVDEPAAVVGEIARRLSIAVTPAQVEAIVTRFSKPSVAARIAEKDQRLRQRISALQPVDRRDVIVLGMKKFRAFDKETGFQTGHVSDYQEGDWRHILTAEQQARLEAVIATSAPTQR
jgi:hypothetical protein